MALGTPCPRQLERRDLRGNAGYVSHQHEVRAAAAMEADGDIARACLLTMCGLPGAGKSTLARAVAARAESDGIRVSLVSFDDVERRLASEKSEASGLP